MTTSEALADPFFADIRNVAEEITAPAAIAVDFDEPLPPPPSGLGGAQARHLMASVMSHMRRPSAPEALTEDGLRRLMTEELKAYD
jgi:hypothetical protein